MPSTVHCRDRYANNRAEASHRHTRQHERQMKRFKSPGQAQRFLSVHSQVHNLFRVGRHLLKALSLSDVSFTSLFYMGTGGVRLLKLYSVSLRDKSRKRNRDRQIDRTSRVHC